MTAAAHGGRVRRVVIRSIIVLVIGAAVLIPILFYASTVDVRAPQVSQFVLTQHLPGDDSVALTSASLEVVFSEQVNHAAAQASFAIAPQVPGTFSWTGLTMVFTPADRLPLETSFSVSLHGGVSDASGNRMSGAGPYAFRTVGSPAVIATRPVDAADGVPLDASIQLTFSTLMDTLSVQRALQIVPQTSVTLRWNGEELIIQPLDRLQPGETYTVTLGTDARDTAGNALGGALHLSFTTVTPRLATNAIVPAAGSEGIAVTSPIAVVFDRAIDPGTVNDRALTISPSVPGGVGLTQLEGAGSLQDSSRRVVRFTPSGTLPANTTFTVTLADSVHGADGAFLPGPLTWTFTTGSPSATLGNQVVFLSTRSGMANLWAMNPDGSNQHQVSAELSPITTYAVSPDGRSFIVGDGARLIEQRADGSNRRVLTEQGMVEFDPAFSPDGSFFVFGRADRATGLGLGLWRRPSEGGTPERIAMESVASSPLASSPPPPSATGSGASAPPPVLRAPRFSADGTRLAFVDMSGSVGIVNLHDGSLTETRFAAVAPPAWLPDDSAPLFSGLPAVNPGGIDGGTGTLAPGSAVLPLTPDGLGLSIAQRAELRLAELADGETTVRTEPLPAGATLPAVDPAGRIAYLSLDARLIGAGRIWIASTSTLVPNQLVLPGDGWETGVAFAPQPGAILVTRVPPATGVAPIATPTETPLASASSEPQPSPAPGTGPGIGGIWLVNQAAGVTTQLGTDGWSALWLP